MKIIFHIGMAKTGTTSLQTYLLKNKELLLSQGFVYEPEALYGGINHNVAISKFLEDPDSTMKILLDRLNLYEKYKKYNYYILSAESAVTYFTQHHIDIFYKYLSKHDIEIVLYVRRQDDFIESLYSELVKEGLKELTIQKAVDMYGCDYKEKIARWQRNERFILHVIRYDSEKTISDFCNIYNINTKQCYNIERQNITPSTNYIEIIDLILNNTNLNLSYSDILNFIQGLTSPKSYRILSLGERKAIMERYEDSNMAISKQFFDGEPLFEPLPTTDTNYIGYPAITQNEIIKVLEKYILYLIRSNNYINKLIDTIKKNGDFDENFYRKTYLCGRAELYKPIEHFVRFGMYEQYKPNEDFDVDKIYNSYPELKEKGIPPYIIYIILKTVEKEQHLS